MESERVLRSRKRYSSKKAQRFSKLARSRWSKTACGTRENDAEGEDTVCAVHNGANSGDNNPKTSLFMYLLFIYKMD